MNYSAWIIGLVLTIGNTAKVFLFFLLERKYHKNGTKVKLSLLYHAISLLIFTVFNILGVCELDLHKLFH